MRAPLFWFAIACGPVACSAPTPAHRQSTPGAIPAAGPAPTGAPLVDGAATHQHGDGTPKPTSFLGSDASYFLVEVERGKARCQRFDVDAASSTMSTTRGPLLERMTFSRTKDGISIEMIERKRG